MTDTEGFLWFQQMLYTAQHYRIVCVVYVLVIFQGLNEIYLARSANINKLFHCGFFNNTVHSFHLSMGGKVWSYDALSLIFCKFA